MRNRYRLAAMIVLISAVAAGGMGWWQVVRLPRRFAAVVPGQLYRSGEVLPGQLERLVEEQGIRRIVCLLDPDAALTRAEERAARALGLEWHNIPLPGDGESTPAEREQILALLSDAEAPPTLVHCAAGANRTGLAIGLYRLRYQGWSLEQTLRELRANGFKDLPKHESLRQALAAEAARARPPTPSADADKPL